VITEGADRLREGSRVLLPGETPGPGGRAGGGGRRRGAGDGPAAGARPGAPASAASGPGSASGLPTEAAAAGTQRMGAAVERRQRREAQAAEATR
jgi:membrane fusion protein, multidrug efflux system